MQRRRLHTGFSLLELLVAFAIMALAVGVLYRAVGSSARHVTNLEVQQRAAKLAQSLLSLRDTIPPGGGWNLGGESAGFNWQIQTAEYPVDFSSGNMPNAANAPKMYEVQATISWVDGGERRNLSLATLRPERKPLPGEVVK